MMKGIVYGVLNSETDRIEKVGSTIKSLRQRTAGYRHHEDWFSENHTLIPLRIVEHEDTEFFPVLLKSVENMEIVRNRTWKEDGGRNILSPLLQWLNHPSMETEIARYGGQRSVEVGSYKFTRDDQKRGNAALSYEERARGGRKQGLKNCLLPGRMSFLGKLADSSAKSKAGKSRRDKLTSLHIRWHVNRGIKSLDCILCGSNS